jgi:hypothetical protein
MRANELLLDPFTEAPIDPNEPPAMFANHIDLGGGYGIWAGAQYMGFEQVGVLLTDPTDANGLGDLDDFKEVVGMFSAVGYADSRSLIVEARRPRDVSEMGAVTPSGEIVPHDSYLDTLRGVIDDQGKTLVSFCMEPGVDHPDLMLAMRRARERAAAEAVLQDAKDSNAELLKPDIEYRNAWQWYGVGRAALEAIRTQSPTLLLVVAAEDGDIANKLDVRGAPNVVASFARPEYIAIPEARSYPFAMRQGYIPGAAFKGARG